MVLTTGGSLDSMPAFRHVFAVENDPAKRGFLRFAHSPPVLVSETSEMLHGQVKNVADEKQAVLSEVPTCDLLVAGFPCTDVSKLNCKANTREHRSIIADGERSTGSTFCDWRASVGSASTSLK